MRLRDLQGNTEPQSKTRIIIGRRYGLTCTRPVQHPARNRRRFLPGLLFSGIAVFRLIPRNFWALPDRCAGSCAADF
jgi:hypothetical protein